MFGGLDIKGSTASASSSSASLQDEKQSDPASSSGGMTGGSSGFSFMTSTPSVDPSAPSGTSGVADADAGGAMSSGFSFLGGANATSNTNIQDEEEHQQENNNNETVTTTAPVEIHYEQQYEGTSEALPTVTSVAAVGSSLLGFSFMGSTNATTTNSATHEPSANTNVITEDVPQAASSESSMSGFSFLSSTLPTSTATPNDNNDASNDIDANNNNNVNSSSNSSVKKQDNNSLFSMLSSSITSEQTTINTSAPSSSAPSSSAPSSLTWGINTKPPIPITTTNTVMNIPTTTTTSFNTTTTATTTSNNEKNDILSLSNPSQPTGSGMVFGGAAKPKAVKKRSRAKKVGLGSSTSTTNTNNSSSMTGSSHVVIPPTVPEMEQTQPQPHQYDPDSNEYEHPPHHENEDHYGQKSLTDEAEEASLRAEEFIYNVQKQQQQQKQYMSGRYSEDQHPHPQDNKHNETSTTDPTKDEEYKKAKAAAEVAIKPNKSKMGSFMSGGGISGLFKRSFATSNSSAASVSRGSNSSVGSNEDATSTSTSTMKKAEWKVPTYGDPSPPTLTTESNTTTKEDDQQQQQYKDDSSIENNNNELSYNQFKTKREEEIKNELKLENERKELERQRLNEELYQKQLLEQQQNREEQQRQVEAAATAAAAKSEQQRLATLKQQQEEERRRLQALPHEKLKSLISNFAIQSQNTTCTMNEIRTSTQTLHQKRKKIEKQIQLTTQQITQAESQQMEAVDQEDFDLADLLAKVMDDHLKEQQDYKLKLKFADDEIDVLEKQRVSSGNELLHYFTSIQTTLATFLEEQKCADVMDCFADKMTKFEVDTKRLAAENERLNADLKNIERDEEFFKEEKGELEGIISEQTADIEVQRDTASEKLNVVNDEIEELRKQLESKEMEAAQIKMELHNHGQSIENIRNNFSRQLTRLAKKEKAVQESRKDWLMEEESYKCSREEHENEVTAHSEALMKHDNLIAQIQSEIVVAGELTKVITNEVIIVQESKTSSTGNGDDDNDNDDDDLIKVQAEVLRCEAAADEANQLLTATKSIIDGLKDEIVTIEVRLPILESEKKLAAAKRDFKAAGKASKEIKELIAKKERYATELDGEAIERQVAARKEVEACIKTLEEKKVLAHKKEKEGGRNRMVQLVKKIIKLEKIRETICGTGEGGIENESITSVGGFVLDSEIAALVSEGEELGAKFGGWTDVMMEYAEDNESEEAVGTEASVDKEVEDIIKDVTKPELEEVAQVEDEEQRQQDQDETELDTDVEADADEKENDEQADGVNDEEKKEAALQRCKVILSKISELESGIEAAIEVEEYDEAAELDDQMHTLKDELQALGLTDAEMEAAKLIEIDDTDSGGESKGSIPSTEKSYDIVDVKAEVEIDDEQEEREAGDM